MLSNFSQWFRWGSVVGLILAILGFFGGLIVQATDITWTFLLIDMAPAIGAWVAIILLLYYGRLLAASQEQAKAARASYTPGLDVSLWPHKRNSFILNRRLQLEIANRGEGVAKNISISLYFRDEPHQYSANINQSLRPGQKFNNISPSRDSPSDSFSFEPRFRFENEEGLMEGSLLNYLKYLENKGGSGPHQAWVEVHWTDIIEEQQYSKKTFIRFPSLSSEGKKPVEPPQQSSYAGTITVVPSGFKPKLKRKLRKLKNLVLTEPEQPIQKFIFSESINLNSVPGFESLD